MESRRQKEQEKEQDIDSTISKGCETSMVRVATMTMGGASDASTSYLGYAPPLDPNGGGLDDTDFSYDGMDYIVEALFYQEQVGGVKQIVFPAGAPLPVELVLQAGHRQFHIYDSLKLGANEDIHAWRLDQPLDWAEEQTVGLQIRAMGSLPRGDLSQ